MVDHDTAVIEWGWAGAALADGPESGDRHVVAPFPDGVLIAVIDGLGHGTEAAFAASAAARLLETAAAEPVVALVQRCHEELRGTRGAVMSLASIDTRTSTMTWIGVGNVEGLLMRANPDATRSREGITNRGGVVGYQLPPLRSGTLTVSPGDTLILATDGIRSAYADGLRPGRAPRQMAESILRDYWRESDDALVLVARYAGPPG
jgi:negative regulator of sigma-B (phosphoserine phosphatase)